MLRLPIYETLQRQKSFLSRSPSSLWSRFLNLNNAGIITPALWLYQAGPQVFRLKAQAVETKTGNLMSFHRLLLHLDISLDRTITVKLKESVSEMTSASVSLLT